MAKMQAQTRTTRNEPSLDQLEQAARAPGADRTARLRWGWALYGAGRFTEAAGVASECSNAASGDPEPGYLLGMALKGSGDNAGAAAAFKVASENVFALKDEARAAMLRRLAIGQVNWLLRGDWDLEPETWVRT